MHHQHPNKNYPLHYYFAKMKGTKQSPPRVPHFYTICSCIGSFLGIAAVAYLNFNILAKSDLMMLIGSFGASAVLLYGAMESPLAQPRNLMGGHIISALIGVSCYKLFPSELWFSSALAVSLAIGAMHLSKTLHPPGGATALIAVLGTTKVHQLGYLYALVPVGAGALIMLTIALIVNNIPKNHRYPYFWL